MCGIAGVLGFNRTVFDKSVIQSITGAISHRGPDADGFFCENQIALGHRRLSIIDLSEAANQPFFDATGRYAIIFNGEIYNYRDIKSEIDNYPFRTTSDTEVILAAYSKWGKESVKLLKGMFAFAIWDRQDQELFIARDRLGVKPLYYSTNEQHFIFASEIRALLESGLVEKKINAAALHEYFNFQSIGYPDTMIRDIKQLEAGSYMSIKDGNILITKYWDIASRSCNYDFDNADEVRQHIRKLLSESVERRLVSDVPVGAFLSGGIDSSAVVALMSQASKEPINTFTVSFEDKEYDESYYAELVSKKYHTHHTNILLKPTVFLDELLNGLNAMDTPSGDGLNTYVVSKAIREKGIKVALSGIGGDELFAGYPIFLQYLQLKKYKPWWFLPSSFRSFLTSSLLRSKPGSRQHKIQQILNGANSSIENVYPVFRQILSPDTLGNLTSEEIYSRSQTGVQDVLVSKKEQLASYDLLSQVSISEYLGYTQNTLLRDTDQMSMAVSLEVREPFFDHELIEYVLCIPDKLKYPSYPKSLLVESLKPLLPDEIIFRKKQGFLFPWQLWMKNELRSFCEKQINDMARRPFINGPNLKSFWNSFLKGDPNVRWAEVWLFVVLEYWLSKNNVE